MRAQSVFKRAYVFDFDETLVKTDAKIHVYRNGAHYRSMDSKEYNDYKRKLGDKLDFSDFKDGELILNAKKYKMWPAIENISAAIKTNRSISEIYILTARTSEAKAYIYEFLKRKGIAIDISHILTIGDESGKKDISNEKRKALVKLVEKYDEVVFYDDDPSNIKLAKSIPGLKSRLIENNIRI